MGIFFTIIALLAGGFLLFAEENVFKVIGVALLLYNFATLIVLLQKLL